MSDYLEKIITALNQLYGLPAVALVLGSCIVLGYALRFIKAFPNDGIPVAVILWGGLVMSIVADARSTTMSLRVWIVRNVLVGMIIGFAAWMLHKAVISKIEDWIASKFPDFNTSFLRKKGLPPTDPGPKPPGT